MFFYEDPRQNFSENILKLNKCNRFVETFRNKDEQRWRTAYILDQIFVLKICCQKSKFSTGKRLIPSITRHNWTNSPSGKLN